MVAKWPTDVDMQAETVTWNDGTVFSWANVAGNGFNQNRLDRIAERIQSTYLDTITPETDFDPEDQYRTSSDAELLARYGGRVFRDGNGNIVERRVLLTLAYDGTSIIPTVTEVR